MPPNERVSIAADGFASVRAVLCVVAATLAATLGDVCLEALIGAGAFGPGYVDRSHATVVPAAALAAAGLLGVAAWLRAEGRYDDDWLLLAARDARRFGFVRAVSGIAPIAFALSAGMERVEQFLGGGAPYGGLPLAGAAGLAIVALFATAALAIAIALGVALRALIGALGTVAVVLRTCVAFFVSRCERTRASYRSRWRSALPLVAVPVRAAGRRGERAPPPPRSSIR